MDCEEKGLRFEIGLMVLMVLFMLAIGGVAAYHSIDQRIDRLENVLLNGNAPSVAGDNGR